MIIAWSKEENETLEEIVTKRWPLLPDDFKRFPKRTKDAVIRRGRTIRFTLFPELAPKDRPRIYTVEDCAPGSITSGQFGQAPASYAIGCDTLHRKTIKVALAQGRGCWSLSPAQVRAKAVELGLLEPF